MMIVTLQQLLLRLLLIYVVSSPTTVIMTLADPLTQANAPPIPQNILNVFQFSQVETGFDPFRGSITFLWTIESPTTSARDQILHGAIILNTTAAAGNPLLTPNSWVALGFGESMLTSDFIMVHAFPNGTGAEILSLVSDDYYKDPVTNPGPSIMAVDQPMVAYQGIGLVIGEFRRFTQPTIGDTTHKAISVGVPTDFVWAYKINPAPTPSEPFKSWHGKYRGRYSILLSTGTPAGPLPAVNVTGLITHGLLMALTWLFVFPFAVYWARFGRSMPSLNKGWMWVHIINQFFGSALTVTLIAYAISLFPANANFGPSRNFHIIKKPHAALGFFLFSLVLVQLVLGPLNQYSLMADSFLPYHKHIKHAHQWTGRVALVLGAAQVGLGIETMWPSQDVGYDGRSGLIMWISYFTLVGVWTILFIGTEVFWSLRVRNSEPIWKRSMFNRSGYSRMKQSKSEEMALMDYRQQQQYPGVPRRGFGIVGGGPQKNKIESQLKPKPDNANWNTYTRTFTWEEINMALRDGQRYVVAKGRYVYDINQWIYSHPGGQAVLNQVAGTDITPDYFNESGYDATAFIPKSAIRATFNRTPLPATAPREVVRSSIFNAGITAVPPPKPSTSLPDFESSAPPLSEIEWKLVLKARRTNVHSRMAIEKLSSLYVGEMAIETNTPLKADEVPFDPFEYRRYALVDSVVTGHSALTPCPVYKQKLCLLFPHDTQRVGEPTTLLAGQCVEIQLQIKGQPCVSRYFTPISGSLQCFEIYVKLEPSGALTPHLVRQKAGDRQIKVRGPFGTPLVHPERPIPRSPSQTWALDKLVFIVAGSGLTVALQAVSWLFLPKLTPLFVIQGYKAAGYDEIDLQEGDWVVTKEHAFDGWACGINIRTGKEGMFPLPVTFPRSGGATQMHILNSMHTADDSFGADMLNGALLAHRQYFSVTHVLTRGIGSPETTRQMHLLEEYCPGRRIVGARIDVSIVTDVLRQVAWHESRPPMRKIVVCGPPAFQGNIYDILSKLEGVIIEVINSMHSE